jgi:NAD-dependent SIR2 family protein deacetylase
MSIEPEAEAEEADLYRCPACHHHKPREDYDTHRGGRQYKTCRSCCEAGRKYRGSVIRTKIVSDPDETVSDLNPRIEAQIRRVLDAFERAVARSPNWTGRV